MLVATAVEAVQHARDYNTLGVVVTVILAVGASTWALSRQIGDIRENFVKKTECDRNRDTCPCAKELADIKAGRITIKGT